jgi:hypothetical protein
MRPLAGAIRSTIRGPVPVIASCPRAVSRAVARGQPFVDAVALAGRGRRRFAGRSSWSKKAVCERITPAAIREVPA